MHDPLPPGGHVRKLWVGEADAYRDHLLRLDPERRQRRFSGAISGEILGRRAATISEVGVVVHGFFVDGVLRGAAELRHIGSPFSSQAEAAFRIAAPWQSPGGGTELLERALLSARNRGIKAMHMQWLPDNHRMQQLARKFEAEIKFDFGAVLGEVDPPRPTPLSFLREAVVDNHNIVTAILDAHWRRLFRPALNTR